MYLVNVRTACIPCICIVFFSCSITDVIITGKCLKTDLMLPSIISLHTSTCSTFFHLIALFSRKLFTYFACFSFSFTTLFPNLLFYSFSVSACCLYSQVLLRDVSLVTEDDKVFLYRFWLSCNAVLSNVYIDQGIMCHCHSATPQEWQLCQRFLAIHIPLILMICSLMGPRSETRCGDPRIATPIHSLHLVFVCLSDQLVLCNL